MAETRPTAASESSLPELMLDHAYAGDPSILAWASSDRVDSKSCVTGNTLLMAAAIGGHVEMVQALLAKSASINLQNKSGLTALMCAVASCQATARLPTIHALLSARADVNLQSLSGATALILAVERTRDLATVSAIISSGARLDVCNSEGSTALMRAAYFGMAECVQELLERKAALDLASNRGATALCLAAQQGHANVTASLLRAGADTSHKSAALEAFEAPEASAAPDASATKSEGATGRTALEWAQANGHVDVIKALRRHSIEQAVAAARATQAAQAELARGGAANGRSPPAGRGGTAVHLTTAAEGRSRSLDSSCLAFDQFANLLDDPLIDPIEEEASSDDEDEVTEESKAMEAERGRRAAGEAAALAASLLASIKPSPRTARRAEQSMAVLIDQSKPYSPGGLLPGQTNATQAAAREGVRRLIERTEDPEEFMARMEAPSETQEQLKNLQAQREETQAERALRVRAAGRRRRGGRGERHSV